MEFPSSPPVRAGTPLSRLGAVLSCSLLALASGPPIAGEEPEKTPDPAERRPTMEDLERRIEALERELKSSRVEPPAAPGAVEVNGVWTREALDKPAPLRGVYDKPFLVSVWRRAYLGGYTELEYHAFHDEPLGIPEGFRAHRTNLFAYADVADTVRFGSEIEFENEEPGEDLEVKVEMAFVDWVIYEEFVIRGGAILAPLGRINVNHDGPVRELTDRPLVSTFVIPTTLTEVGIGPRGTISLTGALDLSYEAYAVNGFDILSRDGDLATPFAERERLLRDGRPSLGGDANRDIATTGRISLAAFDSLDVGGSWHVGTYDERQDNVLGIIAGDAAYVHKLDHGTLALEGEIAWAGFERDDFAETAGVPEEFWGFYLQAAYSHMPELLRQWAPHVFAGEGSAFTLVLRYDWVDLDGDHGEAFEPGLSFRPVADTVFKFSYRFGSRGIGLRGVPGRRDFNDDGFIFSLASYF